MSAVQAIAINKIRVLNPRARNRAKFEEIITNVSKVGLKKPITVCPRAGSGGEYDLVCGQGRRLVEGERLVTVNLGGYFGGGIETEEQLDAAIEGIREECARYIGAGKKVVVQ